MTSSDAFGIADGAGEAKRVTRFDGGNKTGADSRAYFSGNGSYHLEGLVRRYRMISVGTGHGWRIQGDHRPPSLDTHASAREIAVLSMPPRSRKSSS